MLPFFTITLFVSATLLFWVQPMFAKMVLPMLGGTPAVWNTCMVFFQAALLAGYLYAHASTAWLGVRHQAALHVGLVLLPLFTLPIGVRTGWSAPAEGSPIGWLLVLLLVSVGLPFFVLSASAPMLQKWFAATGHRSARDPYFLYGASNMGSLVALVGYPLWMEPRLRLVEQSWVWAWGYALLVVLSIGCAVMLWRSPVVIGAERVLGGASDVQEVAAKGGSLTVSRRVRWVAWSFVPSSLMLGVTTHLSTDITPIPLLWVIPLSLYLLTFVLVFAKRPVLPHQLMVRVLPLVILPLLISILLSLQQPLWLLIMLHLLTFFVAAMVCHGELAKDRPSTEHLTEFYLWMSVGGVLGGLFNVLVAPTVFTTVVEYPLALVLACLLRPRTEPDQGKPLSRWLDVGLPLALGMFSAGLLWSVENSGLKPAWLGVSLVFGLPAVLCFAFRDRPIRFGLGIGAIMLANAFYTGAVRHILHAERSFFGVHRVIVDPEEKFRLLFHGSTIHGWQSLDPARRREPVSYFYRTGPIGQLFASFSGADAKSKVAIAGLGIGSIACHGEPGQQFTFYEIDPAVERIARDPRYFTYLRDCPPKIDVVLGDARLSLQKAPDKHYGLIVLDAFSSDAIPVHLLTREAIELYLTKLADGGILAFQITNRYLDLRPVLGDLARHAGLVCLAQDDSNISETEKEKGKTGSRWVVMARQREDFTKLAQDPRWNLLTGESGAAVWTDDFSNILGVIRWN